MSKCFHAKNTLSMYECGEVGTKKSLRWEYICVSSFTAVREKRGRLRNISKTKKS